MVICPGPPVNAFADPYPCRAGGHTTTASDGAPAEERQHAACVAGERNEGSGDAVDALLEAAGVALLRTSQRLEPLGDLDEALLTRGLGEPGVHLRVLVGLAGDGRLEVVLGLADRLPGGRVADLGEEL